MRSTLRETLLTAVAVACAASCGGSMPMNMDPAPPAHGYQLKTPDFTVAAGEEKYLCYAVTLADPAANVAVTKFQSFAAASVHHFEVFQTIAAEPDGISDCGGSLIKQTWLPLFGGGVAAGGLTLPAGAGFVMPGTTQLLLQLHLVNASAAPVTEHVIVNMDYADDASKVTRAGVYAFGSMQIDLPAGARGTQVKSPTCAMTKDLHVFAVQPHMHKLGTKIQLFTGSDRNAMTVAYQRDPWVFGVQPIDTYDMTIAKGTFGQSVCTFDNTTANEVRYGEHSSDEMCYFVVFYTPFDALDGCVQ